MKKSIASIIIILVIVVILLLLYAYAIHNKSSLSNKGANSTISSNTNSVSQNISSLLSQLNATEPKDYNSSGINTTNPFNSSFNSS